MGHSARNPKPEYICVYLTTKQLDPLTRSALAFFGVEDLEEGEPFQAYGIVDNAESLLAHISGCKMVTSVERRDPPVGM